MSDRGPAVKAEPVDMKESIDLSNEASSSDVMHDDADEPAVKSEAVNGVDESVIKDTPNGKGKDRAEPSLEEQVEAETAHLRAPGDKDEEIVIATVNSFVDRCNNFPGRKSVTQETVFGLRRDRFAAEASTIEIRLDDERGPKVGILRSDVASKLAPLLDRGLVEVEAEPFDIPANLAILKTLPIRLRLIGTRELGLDKKLDFAFPARKRLRELEKEEKRNKKANAKKAESAAVPDTDKIVLEQKPLVPGTVERDGRSRSDAIDELFKEGGHDPFALPSHPCPPGRKDDTMKTDLLPFQKQGLAWMIRMEHPELPKTPDDPPVQLWQMKHDAEGNVVWYNLATEQTQREKPVLRRGGILADEMGLGKTMQTISLICTDDTGEGVLAEPEEPDFRYNDMTLIVCPLSVLSNWDTQLKAHVGTKRMSWHIYHGEGKELSKKELREYDVVITTYQALAAEISDSRRSSRAGSEADGEPQAKKAKRDETLKSIAWRRVVLDEGHVIKNMATLSAQACRALKAERRWILTGTPIINSTSDLGSMIAFLKLCRPLDDPEVWKEQVTKRVGPDKAKLLRAIVASTTLRRTKDMRDAAGKNLVKLPSIKYYTHKVRLHDNARKLYDEISSLGEEIVEKYVNGAPGSQFAYILVLLLRLRQLACDPTMCPQSFIDSVRSTSLEDKIQDSLKHMDGLNALGILDQAREAVRNALRNGTPCMACRNAPNDIRGTICGHVFCALCIEPHIKQYQSCFICNQYIQSTRELVSTSTMSDASSDAGTAPDEAEVPEKHLDIGPNAHPSAKTEALINLLKATEPGVKSLVFSQWVSHLDCIEPALNKAGIVTCRFVGSMSQQRRADLIKEFQKPIIPGKKRKKGEKKPPTVMLISLKAGALGLNLTNASQVFLMDPWWQASIENQAIDRVYRIGQEKEVRVFQLVAENTVEDRVLEIQKEKNELIAQAFSGNKSTGKGAQKIDTKGEIAAIFGLK